MALRVPLPSTPSGWLLVGANAVALLGVLFLGWGLADIMLLYWMESAVIGLFTLLKMLTKRSWGALFYVPFFCFHYGMFMGVHLIFLLAFFVDGGLLGVQRDRGDIARTIWPAVLALLVSHGASFWANYLRGGERERQGLSDIMGAPYPRIVVMHLTIILGGMLAVALGSPIYALALLLVLKTVVDLQAHARERRKAAAPMPS